MNLIYFHSAELEVTIILKNKIFSLSSCRFESASF